MVAVCRAAELREAIYAYAKAMAPYYAGRAPLPASASLTYREAGELREQIYNMLHARTAAWVQGTGPEPWARRADGWPRNDPRP